MTHHQVPWKTLVKVIIILVALSVMDAVTLRSDNSLRFTSRSDSHRVHYLQAQPRQLESNGLVLCPPLSIGERRIVQEQYGADVRIVEYHNTWPEWLGFGLALAFAISCFWFFLSVVSENWTKERAAYVVDGKLSAFASLYFAYSIGAYFGWYWMSWEPFLLMGIVLTTFGLCLKWIPQAASRRKNPKDYLLVNKPRAPKKIKVNPLIRKMFARQEPPHSKAVKLLHKMQRSPEQFSCQIRHWYGDARLHDSWKCDMALERHGAFGIESIVRALCHEDLLEDNALLILEILATRCGNIEEVLAEVLLEIASR